MLSSLQRTPHPGSMGMETALGLSPLFSPQPGVFRGPQTWEAFAATNAGTPQQGVDFFPSRTAAPAISFDAERIGTPQGDQLSMSDLYRVTRGVHSQAEMTALTNPQQRVQLGLPTAQDASPTRMAPLGIPGLPALPGARPIAEVGIGLEAVLGRPMGLSDMASPSFHALTHPRIDPLRGLGSPTELPPLGGGTDRLGLPSMRPVISAVGGLSTNHALYPQSSHMAPLGLGSGS